MFVPAGAFALLLMLPPPPQVHGDFDDDDDHPRQQAAPCPCAVAPCPAAPAPEGAGNGCAEEYLGLVSGVHWYDTWKLCRPNGTCYGAVFEGEPFDDPGLFICSPSGQSCPTSKCIVPVTFAPDSDPLQESLADRLTAFDKNQHGQDPANLTARDFGYAKIKGTDLYFKLFTVTTSYRKETVKVRRIGVELDESKLNAQDVVWDAEWSADNATGSKLHHNIDVIIPDAPYETFHVTTTSEQNG